MHLSIEISPSILVHTYYTHARTHARTHAHTHTHTHAHTHTLHTVSNAERFTRLRNGDNTNTQNYQSGNEQENFNQYQSRRNNNVRADRGMHETFDYYDDCYTRTRNLGEPRFLSSKLTPPCNLRLMSLTASINSSLIPHAKCTGGLGAAVNLHSQSMHV